MLVYLALPLAAMFLAQSDPVDVFALQGERNIMDSEHFGIVNGMATIGIQHEDIAAVHGLWAPPFVSSTFGLDLRFFGEPVACETYTWRPYGVERSGQCHGNIRIDTTTALVPGVRGGLLRVRIRNTSGASIEIPVELSLTATLDRTETWEFSRAASTTPVSPVAENGGLSLTQGPLAIALQALPVSWNWQTGAAAANASFRLEPGAVTSFFVAFVIGEHDAAIQGCQSLAAEPEAALVKAHDVFAQRVQDLFEKLPRLESSNAAFTAFYNRSLVHFLMNRWDVPEFVLHPYYSTGSVKGGCMCEYLWNFGEVWEIFPLYDPEAARTHIKQFLQVDILNHFAFMPVKGDAFGPWYPVNQEKIIGLIYFYVQNTGDRAFLDEVVNGKSVLDWVVANALCHDDPAKPVELIDYGPSNSHLELRRGFPYNHVMPDLNGRRYANYYRAAELADLAGKPAPYLRERAEALKTLLKERLWDPNVKWFLFLNGNGEKNIRYTVQLFKLFGSAVLDAEEEAGLLSHLNETEFLSEQGLHSMSKTDIAYDQVDIDNGGGGICTSFTPQIAERLYRAGHPEVASDILRRVLWWGERMPYWGDSLVANSIDYRKDTPLQCTIDGVAIAQGILFGMLGVQADFDGNLTINPVLPDYVPDLRLTGLRLRGVKLDIAAGPETYTVTANNGPSLTAPLGTRVVWNAARQGLEKQP